MRSLIVMVVVLTLNAAPAAAKNCTLTTSGYAPSTYVRSDAQTATGLTVKAGIVRRAADGTPSAAGFIGFIGIGMSNAETYQVSERREIRYHPEKVPGAVFIRAAQSGKTAKEWANPADAAWSRALYKVQQAGLTPAQIQAAHVYMTNAFPATNGVMTSAQVEAIVLNLVRYFPRLRIVYLSSIGYTYYAFPLDARAPVWSVRGDVTLMETMVRNPSHWPPGVWVDFLDIWADGVKPNAVTASPRVPQGIAYECTDLKDDGIHPIAGVAMPMPTGANEIGINVVERLYADPVTHGWLFR